MPFLGLVRFDAKITQKHSRQLLSKEVLVDRQDVLEHAHAVEQDQFPQNERDQKEMEPRPGLEPGTCRLRIGCSTN